MKISVINVIHNYLLKTMAISRKRIGIYKKKIYNAEVPLQTIHENHNLQLHNSLKIKNNNKLKNSIYWIVFFLFAYFLFYY